MMDDGAEEEDDSAAKEEPPLNAYRSNALNLLSPIMDISAQLEHLGPRKAQK